jgi:hypothetical protein
MKTNVAQTETANYDEGAWEMRGEGVPYVAAALEELNAAIVALDDAQAESVVGSGTIVDELQPAILAVREARHLLKRALEWHAKPARRALKAV